MRIEGWEQKLDQYLEAGNAIELEWGEYDCALWAGYWVREAIGKDYTEPFAGYYTTELGAARRFKKLGYSSVSDIMDAHLDTVALNFAKRGDLALYKDTIGIVNGPYVYCLPREGTGLIRAPLMECTTAWKVE